MRRQSILILTIILALTSSMCTFGGSADGRSGRPVSSEERQAALTDLAALHESLLETSADGYLGTLVENIEARPEFEAAGVAADGSVWGRFTDGRLAIFASPVPAVEEESYIPDTRPNASSNVPIVFNPAAPASAVGVSSAPAFASVGAGDTLASAPPQAGRDVELPGSSKAVVMSVLPAGDLGKEVGSIRNWLTAQKYELLNVQPTVEGLKTVKGVGVFYFATHGGLGKTDFYNPDERPNDFIYALMTSTIFSAENDEKFKEDLNDENLVYFESPDDEEWHYAITLNFIRRHMSFSENSLVFIGGCGSFNFDIKFGFQDADASVFMGWTETVNSFPAGFAAQTLFDLLMGKNEAPFLKLVNPPHRPFDIERVLIYMSERKYDTSPGTRIVFDDAFNEVEESFLSQLMMARLGGNFGILAPSIAYLEVKEDTNELLIRGMFGSEEGEVTIGKTKVDIKNWSSELVTVKLEDKGDGSAGDVVVKVQEHESNVVPLTEWRGKITYTFRADAISAELQATAEINAHLRADIHAYREKPGEEPVERKVKITLAGDSTAEWLSSGSANVGGAQFDVSGDGNLSVLSDQPNHDLGHFEIFGTLMPQGILDGNPPILKDVNFHLHFGKGESKMIITIPGFGTEETDFPILTTEALLDQTLELDNAFNIKAGRREAATVMGVRGPGTGILEWDLLKAKHAPSLSKPPHASLPLGNQAIAAPAEEDFPASASTLNVKPHTDHIAILYILVFACYPKLALLERRSPRA